MEKFSKLGLIKNPVAFCDYQIRSDSYLDHKIVRLDHTVISILQAKFSKRGREVGGGLR